MRKRTIARPETDAFSYSTNSLAASPDVAALAHAALAEVEELRAALASTTDALRLIEDGPADPAMNADAQWCAGVAMSALASLDEVGYPRDRLAPGFEGDPYTMGLVLCDPDGIVRSGRYPCTGHAHFAGEHIECLSNAHKLLEGILRALRSHGRDRREAG